MFDFIFQFSSPQEQIFSVYLFIELSSLLDCSEANTKLGSISNSSEFDWIWCRFNVDKLLARFLVLGKLHEQFYKRSNGSNKNLSFFLEFKTFLEVCSHWNTVRFELMISEEKGCDDKKFSFPYSARSNKTNSKSVSQIFTSLKNLHFPEIIIFLS